MGDGGELSSSDSHTSHAHIFIPSIIHRFFFFFYSLPASLTSILPHFFFLPTLPFQFNPKPTRTTSRFIQSLHHPSFFICTGISHPSRIVFGPNLHVVMDGLSVRRMNVGRVSSPMILSLLLTFMRLQRNGRICRCFLNHSVNLYVLI